ncbi:MAG: copper resistance protein CopC [Bradyrhizobiaceae bacterium]|nr:copper resistance protein CopC [Bradyrhizobiaceae bacterium]
MATPHKAVVAVSSASLFLWTVAAASAHGHFVRATPAEDGAVKDAPAEVTLKFNERLEPALSSAVSSATARATGRQGRCARRQGRPHGGAGFVAGA